MNVNFSKRSISGRYVVTWDTDIFYVNVSSITLNRAVGSLPQYRLNPRVISWEEYEELSEKQER